MTDAPKLSLAELKKQAIAPSTKEVVRLPTPNKKRMQRAITSRLVASEYLRNGLDLKKAYEGVTHKRYTPAKFNSILAHDTAFLDEINLALTSADIEKNKVLGMLWAMASISPLDFMDDDGVTLSVKDLKALPREMQAMIEQVDVVNEQVVLKDDDGNTINGPDGLPLLRIVQHVKVRVVKSKKDALAIIAQIGKMIGPTMLNQTNVTVFNVGQAMADADTRRLAALQERGIIEAPVGDDTPSS